MKLTRKSALVASAALATSALFVTVAITSKSNAPAPQPSLARAQHIDSQPGAISYKGRSGQTALQLLQEVAHVQTKDSSYGTYVDEINGLKGGTDGKYWSFFVNGTLATSGADAYLTQEGDVIEWKFQ